MEQSYILNDQDKLELIARTAASPVIRKVYATCASWPPP